MCGNGNTDALGVWHAGIGLLQAQGPPLCWTWSPLPCRAPAFACYERGRAGPWPRPGQARVVPLPEGSVRSRRGAGPLPPQGWPLSSPATGRASPGHWAWPPGAPSFPLYFLYVPLYSLHLPLYFLQFPLLTTTPLYNSFRERKFDLWVAVRR